MPVKSAPLAGFLPQAESLFVPNSMISRPNMRKSPRIVGIVPVFWRIDMETWFDCTA
jgi:hypothetical protein